MNLNQILLIFGFITIAHSYSILFVAPFPGPSHWVTLKHFVRELLNRGHAVTALTTFPYKDTHLNYTEVLIDPPFDLHRDYAPESFFTSNYKSDFASVLMYWHMGLTSSEHGLSDPKIQKFIKSKNLKFDLLICEQFFHESWLVFAHKFNVPIVTISTLGHSDYMDRSMGLFTPWSHVPHQLILDWGDNMNFLQRSYNVLLCSYDMIFRYFYYLPQQQKHIDIYFAPHIDSSIPSVYELEQSISLRLLNSHPSLSKPRPSLPGMIDVAGAHIQSANPLPADLQSILDQAKDGVIYFSLGAYLQSSHMPKERVKEILSAFGTLKQTVLWKWEDDSLDAPPNVILRKWLPQNDILAHKNVVLFISHGGLFGTTEGVYRGLPILFIPIYGDQNRNAQQITDAGFGKIIKFSELTKTVLLANIKELIRNTTYSENAKRVSSEFRDNLAHPMDVSIYWIEYVIRHKGAPFLQSGAKRLSWPQYLLWDVFAFYFCILTIFIYIIFKRLKMLCQRKSSKTAKSKAKKNK